MKNSQRDRELIARVAEGEQNALKQLYDSYSDHMNSFVRNYLADPQEAADVVHEAMLDVWRQAGRFSNRSTVKSWMFAIARNKAIDRNRKGARAIVAEVDTQIPDETPGAQAILEAFQDAERVRHCIEHLSDIQKSVIHLAFYEDFSYSEIAKIEDCPTGTVKTRIMAAKKSLLKCLSAGE